jgi:hypothetical protein
MRVLLLFFLLISSTIYSKVYDCFLFFDEFEILKCRMEELNDYVDYFVLIESCETFQGNAKPLYFDENKIEFSKYIDKIIHIPLRNKQTGVINSPWDRENFQRDQIQNLGLSHCDEDDIIIISDADEIPRGSILQSMFNQIKQGKKHLLLFQMGTNFFMNRTYGNWPGTVITTKKFIDNEYCLWGMRINRERIIPKSNWVYNGGWHFASCGGGYQRLVRKFESFSHVESNIPKNKTLKYWQDEVNKRRLIPIDDSFPKYVVKNQKRLIEEGYIDTIEIH